MPPTAVHRIRLRGPWTYEWKTNPPSDVQPTGTVKLPADWSELFGDATGTVVFHRPFNRPTNLGEERVLMVCGDKAGVVACRINDESAPVRTCETLTGAVEADLTSALQLNNTLSLTVETRQGHERDGLADPVWLEIRSAT